MRHADFAEVNAVQHDGVQVLRMLIGVGRGHCVEGQILVQDVAHGDAQHVAQAEIQRFHVIDLA